MEKVEKKKDENCRCCQCARFKPEVLKDNCPISNEILKLWAKYEVDILVKGCPEFTIRAKGFIHSLLGAY